MTKQAPTQYDTVCRDESLCCGLTLAPWTTCSPDHEGPLWLLPGDGH